MKNLFGVVIIVLLGFFSIGIPLAVLPGHVRDHLILGNTLIGIVIGLQSLVTLLTRHFAGVIADSKGARAAVGRGIMLLIISGSLTLVSLQLHGNSALLFLLIGRMVLGAGESLLITGALAWGIGLVGPAKTGRVMAWSGMAMYAAIAASAPVANLIGEHFGFSFILASAILFPSVAGIVSVFIPPTPAIGGGRMPFYEVLDRVWKPGVGLALSAVSFVGLAGFAALLFKERGWANASLVMTFFGAAYIAARLLFASTPDKFGGKNVALVSLALAAAGQAMLFLAETPLWAFAGSVLTGFGYSLTFPSFGVEAVKSVETQFKGVALGAYVAFFDLSLAVTAPLAGFIAGNFSYSAVYLFGLLSCAAAFVLALQIQKPKEAA